MTHPIEHQSLEKFAGRVGDVVTTLNGLISIIVNDEVTASDFGDDLSEVLAKLKQVEAVTYELETIFWKWSNDTEEEIR